MSKAIAYVDGSFNVKENIYGSGIIILINDEVIKKQLSGSEAELASMRNVAGEIIGAQYVMEYCNEHAIDELDLYYDYTGIEYWCTGAWKANKPATQDYRDFYNYVIVGNVDVTFKKVKAHSGDIYNEEADRLAKLAAKII